MYSQCLEIDPLSGVILSNRVYLLRNKGFDPTLKAYYAEHLPVFDDIKGKIMHAFNVNMLINT